MYCPRRLQAPIHVGIRCGLSAGFHLGCGPRDQSHRRAIRWQAEAVRADRRNMCRVNVSQVTISSVLLGLPFRTCVIGRSFAGHQMILNTFDAAKWFARRLLTSYLI